MSYMNNAKKQKAEIYTAHVNLEGTKESICNDAFQAGWKAAMSYLSRMPFDEILKTIEGNMEDKE